MSDIRGYSGIAERADPSDLAGQLNMHRAEMNGAILAEGGTVMQYVGDAVMAVFGAPVPTTDHADRALAAALRMHDAPDRVNADVGRRRPAGLRDRHRAVDRARWPRPCSDRRSGPSTRWSETPLTCVSACRTSLAPVGRTVLSEATWERLESRPGEAEKLEPQLVKGRAAPVDAYRIGAADLGGTQGATT